MAAAVAESSDWRPRSSFWASRSVVAKLAATPALTPHPKASAPLADAGPAAATAADSTAAASPATPTARALAGASAAAALVWKRALRAERALPVFLDMAEDRSRHRGLTVALFAFVFLFVARAGLFVLFLGFPLGLQPAPQRVLRSSAPAAAELGGPFAGLATPVTVCSSSSAGGASGRSISLSLTLASPELALLLTANGFANTSLDLSGVPMGGRFSLPGFPPIALQQPLLTGATVVTDLTGCAHFRGLRALAGLPGEYLLVATDATPSDAAAQGAQLQLQQLLIGKVRLTSAVGNVTILADGREPRRFGHRGPAPRIAPGSLLPPITVRVASSTGTSLPNKVCVLVTAPLEGQEFSNVGARPDVFHPRSALLDNAFSPPTDSKGVTTFANVTLRASSIRHVRLWAVCDGVVAGYENGGGNSIVFSARRSDDEASTLVATVVTQPSPRVLEGSALAQQPALLLELVSRATGKRAPAVGAVAFAFVAQEASGFRSSNVMSPTASAELGILGGTLGAVLGNLGRTKRLVNFVSQPADAQGLARFSGLGFIRHGPAGMYALGFASCGVIAGVTTSQVDVLSSVTNVTWLSHPLMEQEFVAMRSDALGTPFPSIGALSNSANILGNLADPFAPGGMLPVLSSASPPSRIAATICNWPTCLAEWGSSVGYSVKNSSVRVQDLRYSSSRPTPKFRAQASGVLSSPPTLIITDHLGRPLAGKSAMAVVDAGNVSLAELPFTGASVSKLVVQPSAGLLYGSFLLLGLLDGNSAYLRNASNGTCCQSLVVDLLQSLAARPTYGSSFLAYRNDALGADVSGGQPEDNGLEPFDALAWAAASAETFDAGSSFRVVAAPAGHSVSSLSFLVEGVPSASSQLHIYNLDNESTTEDHSQEPWIRPAPTLCAHIRILQQPAGVVQDGSVHVNASQNLTMPLSFRGADGSPRPFVVQAVNSFGEPVAVAGIGMYAVDALGYVMETSVGGDHVALTSDYTRFLRSLGGAAALTVGNFSAMAIGRQQLHAPQVLASANASGLASFPTTFLRRTQNTWIRFAFVALYPDIKGFQFIEGFQNYSSDDLSGVNEFFDGPAACVSEYSAPVTIESTVGELSWAWPQPAASNSTLRAQLAPGSNLPASLPPLPPLRVTASKLAALGTPSASSFPDINLLGVSDNLFSSVPAHVGTTARDYEPIRSVALMDSQYVYSGSLPQLGNGLVPSSRDDVDEIFQVAAVTPAVDSTLGLVLQRWLWNSSEQARITGTVSTGSITAGPLASALATFPQLSSSFGNVGDFGFFAMCGGVVSDEPVSVSYDDDIDAVIVLDHNEALPQLCPRNSTVLEFLSDIPLEEQPARDDCNGNCSGHGRCVCGTCVCSEGFDGAEDCSLLFRDDRFGTFFSDEEQYSDRYGGLVVYDVRLAMARVVNASFSGDVFPRVALAAQVALGRLNASNFSEAGGAIAAAASSPAAGVLLPTYAGVPRAEQAADAANTLASEGLFPALDGAFGTGLPTNASSRAFAASVFRNISLQARVAPAPSGGGYRVFPTLFTCSGTEVTGWWFAPAWSGCVADQLSIFASGDGTGSLVDFSSWSFEVLSSRGFEDATTRDHRLFLGGVPSGCYRFRYGYAPQGGGDRALRSVFGVASSSQALSLGASRPFRVLGLVSAVELVTNEFSELTASINIPRDQPLPYTLTVAVTLYGDSDASIIVSDRCSNAPSTDFDELRNPRRPTQAPLRCFDPGSTSNLLDVTVSAVNVATDAEYSLYIPTKTNDCSRAAYGVLSSPDVPDKRYVARFESLTMPSVPRLPPGPAGQVGSAQALEMRAGSYHLVFSAYGMRTVVKSFAITVVDDPTHLVVKFANESAPGLADVRFAAAVALLVCCRSDESFRLNGNTTACSSCLRDVLEGSVIPAAAEVVGTTLPTSAAAASFPIGGGFRVDARVARNLPADADASIINALNALDHDVGVWRGAESAPISGILVQADVVYGPPRNNAVLVSSSALTRFFPGNLAFPGGEGFADLGQLTFTSGVSGLYVLRFSAAGSADPAYAAVQLTNPVASVSVSLGGRVLTTSAAQATRLVEATELAPSLRVCAAGAASLPAKSWAADTVSVRVLQEGAGSDYPRSGIVPPLPPAPTPLMASAWTSLLGALVRLAAPSPLVWALGGAADSRVPVRVGLRATVSALGRPDVSCDPRSCSAAVALGDDGCVTFSRTSFTNLGVSQRVSLVFDVRGVEGAPLTLDLVTIQDANPVTLDSIRNQILLPLFVMVPVYGANSVGMSMPARIACTALAFAGVAAIALTSGKDFLTGAAQLRLAFSPQDVAFVEALNDAWWLCLCVVAAFLVLAAAPLCCFAPWARYIVPRLPHSRANTLAASRGAGGGVSDALPAAAHSDKEISPQAWGFYSAHLLAARAYVRRLLPRIVARVREVEAAEAANSSASIYAGIVQLKPTSVFAPPAPSTRIAEVPSEDRREKERVPPLQPKKSVLQRAAELCSSLAALESSAEAFFLPQRLLVALAVSVVLVGLCAMLVSFGMQHLIDWAEVGFEALLEQESNVIKTVNAELRTVADEVASAIGAAISAAAPEIPETISAAASSAFRDAYVFAVQEALLVLGSGSGDVNGSSIASDVAARLSPALRRVLPAIGAGARAVLSGANPTVDSFISNVLERQRSIAAPWIAASVASLRSAVSAGLILSAVVVALTWLQLLLTYRRIVLAIRRGNVRAMPEGFRWVPHRASPHQAMSFVGVQAVSTMVSFFLFTVVFTGVFVLSSVPLVRAFVLDRAIAGVSLAAVGALALTLLQKFLKTCTVDNKTGVLRYRRLFSFADIYFTFMNVVTGVVVTIIRFAIFVGSFFALLMRPDISAVPRDPAVAAFSGMLLLDTTFNNPVAMVAHDILRASLKRIRARRAMAAAKIAAAAAAAASKAALPRAASLRSGGSQPDEVVAVNPLARKGRPGTLLPAEASALRARSRWWLFALLAAHPQLIAYRFRGRHADADDDGEASDGERGERGERADKAS